MILLPRAAEELKIPFVASGGMADGRSLVAALALGADGMNMGTRFIATKEAPVHDNVKQAHRRRLRARHPADHARAAQHRARAEQRRASSGCWRSSARRAPALTIADIHEQVAGVYPKVMIDGDMDAGAWSCGMVAGLIHDIPTVAGTDRPHHGRRRTPDPRSVDGLAWQLIDAGDEGGVKTQSRGAGKESGLWRGRAVKRASQNALIYRHKLKPFDFADAMTITAPRLAHVRDVDR